LWSGIELNRWGGRIYTCGSFFAARERLRSEKPSYIAKAKAEGRYKGRPPSIDRAKVQELLTRMGPAEAAKTLGVARSSIYRMIS
jgi:DNA invertase Pin-like site-specific DNA recombinase